MYDYNNVVVDIAPQIKGYVTPRDLITANGTFTFWIRVDDVKTGYLFRVISSNYHLEVGFIRNKFYILRNDKILELPIEFTHEPRYAFCVVMWQPTELKLIVYDKSEKREKTLRTHPTIPPNSLIDWARREAIIPTTIYDSVHDFYETVVSSL